MTIRLCTPLAAHFSDLAEVVHIFYPNAEVVSTEHDAELSHAHREGDGFLEDSICGWGRRFQWTTRLSGDHWEQKRRRKRGMKQCLYHFLREHTGDSPLWGSLTGIRPTRLFYERLSLGETPEEAEAALVRMYDLREDRARLLRETVDTQRGLIDASENAVDLYVGIPFCATRCAYCSFYAEAVGRGRRVPPYLEALFREIDAAAVLIQEKGLIPRALYVGGGTPTALSAKQLDALLDALGTRFPSLREWTVEAGRPDTMDEAKLSVLRAHPVTRISVNPQTMNDQTLRAIGRAHTAQDCVEAFTRARMAGFSDINMDVIAALPGETEADFARTLQAIRKLDPESVTIHTLARKHGSRLNEFGFDPAPSEVASAMVETGAACMRGMGLRPYYLYRQKYVAGNLENVGYARAGRECLYNIDLMEETTSVLALGAGAISKRIFPGGTRIERAPNVREIGNYIARVDEMIARKRQLWEADAND